MIMRGSLPIKGKKELEGELILSNPNSQALAIFLLSTFIFHPMFRQTLNTYSNKKTGTVAAPGSWITSGDI
jgi:hypothetical protein